MDWFSRSESRSLHFSSIYLVAKRAKVVRDAKRVKVVRDVMRRVVLVMRRVVLVMRRVVVNLKTVKAGLRVRAVNLKTVAADLRVRAASLRVRAASLKTVVNLKTTAARNLNESRRNSMKFQIDCEKGRRASLKKSKIAEPRAKRIFA